MIEGRGDLNAVMFVCFTIGALVGSIVTFAMVMS